MVMATLYEENVKKLLDEKTRKMEELRQNPDVEQYEIEKVEKEIGILKMLLENYVSGMGAFRRVRGATEKQ